MLQVLFVMKLSQRFVDVNLSSHTMHVHSFLVRCSVIQWSWSSDDL